MACTMTADVPTTRAISDEAIRAAIEAENMWLRDNCSQCGRPFATTEDWRAQTAPGARSDLCWEPDGQCSWTFSSIEPDVLRLRAVLTATLPHLAQPPEETVEAGARAICVARGLNPDDPMITWSADKDGQLSSRPTARWEGHADDARAALAQSSGRGADHARDDLARAWREGVSDADAAWKSSMAMSFTGRESIENPYRADEVTGR
jgi:hypothetical protein